MYNCTGNPHPRDIERVVQSMMVDEFGTAYSREFFFFFLIVMAGRQKGEGGSLLQMTNSDADEMMNGA